MKARFYVCSSVVRKGSSGSEILLSKTGLMSYNKAYSYFCSIRKNILNDSNSYNKVIVLSRETLYAVTDSSVYRFYIGSIPVFKSIKSL